MIDGSKKRKRRKWGITLIEVLLYTALITIFITLALPLIIDLQMWRGEQSKRYQAMNDYLFIRAYVTNLIENADQIVAPSANESSNNLTISTDDKNIVFGTDENGVYAEIDDEEKIYITKKSGVHSIYFERMSVGTLEKIEFFVILNDLYFGKTSLIVSNN